LPGRGFRVEFYGLPAYWQNRNFHGRYSNQLTPYKTNA
jgi:hypothetical protein